MRLSRISPIALLALTALGLVVPTFADTLVTSKTHSDPFMGQPAKDETSTTWIAKDRMSRVGEDASFIIRLDQKKLYMIDHSDKTYAVVDLPIDLGKYFPAEMQAQIGAMMQQMKMTATVTPTDETKKINQWMARRHAVAISNAMGMKIDIDMWVAKDVDIDMSAYKDMVINMQGLQMGFEDVSKAMAAIDGMTVLSETTMNMMGQTMKSREEVVSIEKKAAPAGTYDVPAGYKEETFNPMKAAQNQGE